MVVWELGRCFQDRLSLNGGYRLELDFLLPYKVSGHLLMEGLVVDTLYLFLAPEAFVVDPRERYTIQGYGSYQVDDKRRLGLVVGA